MHDSEAGVHFTPILHECNECDIGALAHAVQDVIEYIFREKHMSNKTIIILGDYTQRDVTKQGTN